MNRDEMEPCKSYLCRWIRSGVIFLENCAYMRYQNDEDVMAYRDAVKYLQNRQIEVIHEVNK